MLNKKLRNLLFFAILVLFYLLLRFNGFLASLDDDSCFTRPSSCVNSMSLPTDCYNVFINISCHFYANEETLICSAGVYILNAPHVDADNIKVTLFFQVARSFLPHRDYSSVSLCLSCAFRHKTLAPVYLRSVFRMTATTAR